MHGAPRRGNKCARRERQPAGDTPIDRPACATGRGRIVRRHRSTEVDQTPARPSSSAITPVSAQGKAVWCTGSRPRGSRGSLYVDPAAGNDQLQRQTMPSSSHSCGARLPVSVYQKCVTIRAARGSSSSRPSGGTGSPSRDPAQFAVIAVQQPIPPTSVTSAPQTGHSLSSSPGEPNSPGLAPEVRPVNIGRVARREGGSARRLRCCFLRRVLMTPASQDPW